MSLPCVKAIRIWTYHQLPKLLIMSPSYHTNNYKDCRGKKFKELEWEKNLIGWETLLSTLADSRTVVRFAEERPISQETPKYEAIALMLQQDAKICHISRKFKAKTKFMSTNKPFPSWFSTTLSAYKITCYNRINYFLSLKHSVFTEIFIRLKKS